MMAEGLGEYSGARRGVLENAQKYEDTLRERGQNLGMAGIGMYEGAARGDWNQALEKAQLDLQSLQPELQAWGTGLGAAQGAAGLEQQGQGMQNNYALQVWQELMRKAKTPGAGSVLGQIIPLLAGSLFPPAGAAGAAAAVTK